MNMPKMLQIHEQQRGQEFYMKQSDLFDNKVYVEEICDVICIALAELPAVLSIQDVVETLLHVKHGPEIICWVVANSPDCFREGELYSDLFINLLVSYDCPQFWFLLI
jgi:integrator complex subunit 2